MADNITAESALKNVLFNSACITFTRYDGTIAFSRTDSSGSSVYQITDSDLYLSKNIPNVKISFTDAKSLITGIVIKYKKNFTEDNKFDGIKHCYSIYTQQGSYPSNFKTVDSFGGWQYYQSLLNTAYAYSGKSNNLTIECSGIRDEETAEKLAKVLILQRYKPMAKIVLTGKYTLLKLEIGDEITTDISYLDQFDLNSKFYKVTGVSQVPNIRGEMGKVKITITEIGAANLPETVEWIDSLVSSHQKIDSFSTGKTYAEVL